MAYQSGEFALPDNWSYFNYAPAIFNDTLFMINFIGRAGQYRMVQTTFPLSDLQSSTAPPDEPINGDKLTNKANWTTTQLEWIQSAAKPSIAVTTDKMYLFINQITSYGGPIDPFEPPPTTQLSALKYPKSDDDPTSWSDPIQLLETDGKTAPSPIYPLNGGYGADVSVTVFDENYIIVTCASATSANQTTPATFVGLYNVKDQTNATEWTAQWCSYFPLVPGLDQNNARHISTEWYSAMEDIHGNPTENLNFYLFSIVMADNLEAGDEQHIYPLASYLKLPLEVTEAKDGTATLQMNLANPYIVDALGIDLFIMADPRLPDGAPPFLIADLQRDPAGRLRALLAPRDNSKYKVFLSANLKAARGVNKTNFTISKDVFEVSDSVIFPSSIYYTFPTSYPDKIPAPKPGNPDLATVNYPVYEFIFYGGSGEYNPFCQVNRCGTIQVVSDPPSNPRLLGNPTPSTINIIGGIINGPIPYPFVNFQNANPGSSDASAGDLTYGTKDTTKTGRSVSKSTSFGFEAESKTTEGFGPAFKISLHSGSGSVSENTVETELIENFTQKAAVTYDVNLKNPIAEVDGMIKILTCETIVTAYSYLDTFADSVNSLSGESSSGMKSGMVVNSFPDSGDFLNFVPYDVSPGDLTSYQPSNLNAKMNKSYGGTNYFGDIICQNALPFGDKNYLEYTWSGSGEVTYDFEYMTSTYRENSWTYDDSIYAGVSGGGGFDLFGIGEKVEGSVLFGVDLTRDVTDSVVQEKSWGIDIPELKTLPTQVSEGVKKYTFRLYFLPVPQPPSPLAANYWTTELIKYANDPKLASQIDPNSACWRIVYVVTDIEYNDGTIFTYPAGSLDKPSYYENNSSTVKQPTVEEVVDDCKTV